MHAITAGCNRPRQPMSPADVTMRSTRDRRTFTTLRKLWLMLQRVKLGG
jgi:hypothetical protein